MNILLILLGVLLLYAGGELLVRNATKLAALWGLSPLVIGLTIVAFGTSSPELAASLIAALQDSPEIAIGNVVGSNIANVGLILGLTALIYPLRTQASVIRREVPIMVGAALLVPLSLLDGTVSRLEGAIGVLLLAGFTYMLIRTDEKPEVTQEYEAEYTSSETPSPWLAGLGIVVGLALLVGGAQSLVSGATAIARALGVPELVIGLTLVAVGTSLPELATSLIAALKKESEIALGNIVGSNIFNVLGILGVTALVRPINVPLQAVGIDVIVMIGFSLVLIPFLLTGLRLGRLEGAIFIALYATYVVYLYMQ